MRADTHYVDHVGSHASGQPVRMVDVEQIASAHSPDAADLRPLIESIRTHGIVHPLLIARRDAAYVVIAGHKRLGAAKVLKLPSVPCLVHSVDSAQAALLARADNLQVTSPSRVGPRTPMVGEVSHAIAQHVAVVHGSVALMRTRRPQLARATVDLVAAHAWRAARLIDALETVDGALARGRRLRALAAVVDRVVDGFANEARLTGVDVRARVEGAAAGVPVDELDLSTVVSSGVLAMLPLVDEADVDRATILVGASSGSAGSVRVVVSQSGAPTPAALATRFFDETYGERPGGWCAVVCARAVQAVAERAKGTATFDIDPQGHCSLTIDLPSA
jgi:hypothetical protein